MRTIFAEYNPQCNSIDVYTSAGYMLRIDCWEAEKKLKATIIKKQKELLRALLGQFCKLEFTLINIFQTLYDYQSGLL